MLWTSYKEDPPSEVVPVGGCVYDGGGHEGEGRHLDGAEEGDEQVEPGHGGGQGDWNVL